MKKLIESIITLIMICVTAFSCALANITITTSGTGTEKLGNFLAAHPDVTIVTEPGRYYSSTSNLTNDLMFGTFPFDQFPMITSSIDTKTVFQKGYCLDLSGSEKIREKMDKLYPAIAQQCMMGDKIYAIPTWIEMDYIGFSQSTLAKTEFGEIETPTTFPEFLDFLELWVEYQKEHPDSEIALLGESYWDDYTKSGYVRFLTERLLDNFIMQKEYAGEPLNFDDDELIGCLNRIVRIGADLYAYDQGKYRVGSIVSLESNVAIRSDYPFLSLRMNRSQPHLIRTQVYLSCIYAGTKSPELCTELMEEIMDHPEPRTRSYLEKEVELVIRDDYEINRAGWAKKIADTENALNQKKLTDAERSELTVALKQYRNNMDRLEVSGKYVMSPTQLEQYAAMAEYMYVQKPGTFSSNNKDAAGLFQQVKKQFSAGLITPSQLVNELNKVARMVEMEEGK